MIELTYQRRQYRGEDPHIAPFIGGMNVWNLPPEQWTTEVQHAVRHAYELGYRKAIEDMSRTRLALPEEWKEEK